MYSKQVLAILVVWCVTISKISGDIGDKQRTTDIQQLTLGKCVDLPLQTREGEFAPGYGQSTRYFGKYVPMLMPTIFIVGIIKNSFQRISVNLYDDAQGEFGLTENVPLHIKLLPKRQIERNSYVNNRWSTPEISVYHGLKAGSPLDIKISHVKTEKGYAYDIFINGNYSFTYGERTSFKVLDTKYIVIHGDVKVLNVFECNDAQDLVPYELIPEDQ